MGSFTVSINKMAKLDFLNPNVNFPRSSLQSTETMHVKEYAIGFSQIGSEHRYKNITAANIHVNFHPYEGKLFYPVFRTIKSAWDENTVTHNNKPEVWYNPEITGGLAYGDYDQWLSATLFDVASSLKNEHLFDLLNYGCILDSKIVQGGDDRALFYTGIGSNVPYLEVVYDGNASLKIGSASPSSGYIAKTKSNDFVWGYVKEGNCIGSLSVANSEFYYRNGTSGSFTKVSCGTETHYTLPANTVTSDVFQWYAKITDNAGNTSTSDTFSLSSVESLSSSRCLYPVNTVVDGMKQLAFQWEHIISTGTEQTRAELQYSENGTDWISLASVSGTEKQTLIAAGTFSSGDKYWRVRTYNTDNAAGSWSEPTQFIVISAPVTPSVSSEQNPRPKITWQSSEQQGYQVRIDGIFDSGTVYGTETEFISPKYLEDGSYSVNVRVQNIYGIWSDWGAAPVNVINSPGDAITLEASDGASAILRWTTSGNYSGGFLVYRDGLPICITAEKSFIDNFVAGNHEYAVRGIYSDSMNYGMSNRISASSVPDTVIITDLKNINWIPLQHTSDSVREIKTSHRKVSSEIHLSGSRYPAVFMSPHEEKRITFDVSFLVNSERIGEFEKLLGQKVCLKTPQGECVIGALTEFIKTMSVFYTAFSCTISQMSWNEEISL